MDDLANLAELDEELRRVGGDDEDVGMGLDEDAGVFLVGFAQVFAGGDGFATRVSRSGASPMRMQLAQRPQKSGRPSRSVGGGS